ncbi:hypothetical protein LXL04_006436 [Taraxacum kok-saghyz]
MTMANLLTSTPSMILAPQRLSSRPKAKRSYYTSPTSSFTLPLIHAVKLKQSSALVKRNSGFGGNISTSESFRSNSILLFNDLNQFKCHATKTDPVVDPAKVKQSKRPNNDRSPRRFGNSLYAIVIGTTVFVFLGICTLKVPNLIPPSSHQMKNVPYSDLIGGIQDGSVIRVQFDENSRQIYFNTKTPLQDQNLENPQTDLVDSYRPTKTNLPKWQYHTRNVEDDRYEILNLLKAKKITYGSNCALMSQSLKNFLFVFFQVTPFWLMVLLSCYQITAQHDLGKIMKRKPSKKQSVTFDDVKGVDAAKTELLEIILCMKGDKNYTKLGAKLPQGVLLTGPPGTGKTLLARAVAGEANVAFFSISASELVEVFVGRGAARVRDLFREARKNSPSIIFIDEIDAVGGQRGATLNCERDQTLNQLLTEMDGFEKDTNVVVIAATNRPETLDSALLRPGRFSRKVRVDAPDEKGRKDIFALYIKDVPMEDDKEEISELVASLTSGLVGADLENIACESVLLAGRRGGDCVTEDDVLEAVDRAKSKVYDDVPETKGPTMQDYLQGGAMGFGFSN